MVHNTISITARVRTTGVSNYSIRLRRGQPQHKISFAYSARPFKPPSLRLLMLTRSTRTSIAVVDLRHQATASLLGGYYKPITYSVVNALIMLIYGVAGVLDSHSSR